MNEKLQIFKNDQFGQVRTIISEDGEPRFCLADVCSGLNLQPTAVIRRLSDGVISSHPILDSLGRTQDANFVNEEGLYETIFESRKPEAKAFRHWVFSEVLPSIRKTGHYGTPHVDDEWAEENAIATQKWKQDVIDVASKFGLTKTGADCLMSYGAYMASLGPEYDISMTEFAKHYGMGYRAFCDLLASTRLIIQEGSKWRYLVEKDYGPDQLLPMTRVYTVTVDGKPGSTYNKWTAFGRAFVQYKLIKLRGITPIDGCYGYTPSQCHKINAKH